MCWQVAVLIGTVCVFQVVYVTAIMPYVILLILFIRGLFLEGSAKGMKYFINPRIDRLADPIVSTRIVHL